MKEIKITINGKIATGDGTKIVCDNSDYRAVFLFDEEWEQEAVKTICVKYGTHKFEQPFTGNAVDLPKFSNVRGIKIGVYAGDLSTTTPAFFDCLGSILEGAETHEDPQTDVYNELVELASETREIAQGASESAAEAVETANDAKETADSVVDAELGRTLAEQSRAAAEAERLTAEQSRADAEQARSVAEEQRQTAEISRNTAEQSRATAEAQRVTAEQGRMEAEQRRVEADAERLAAINAAAPSIVLHEAGEFITVKDAASRGVVDIAILGATDGDRCVKAGTKIKATGKNFVEITSDITRTGGSLTVYMSAAANTCVVNGVVDATNSFSTTYRAKLAAGTYTASVVGLNEIDARSDRIYVFDANSREVYINYITSRQAGTFTLTEACDVGITFVFATGSSYDYKQVSVQIQSGETATAHEPYTTGGELETPCDLFEGDVWHPLTGVVEKAGAPDALQYPMQALSTCHGVTNITQTPIELTAALGVEYVADTKLYIDNKIAELAGR